MKRQGSPAPLLHLVPLIGLDEGVLMTLEQPVAQPFYEMGVRACRRLIHLIEKGQNSRTKVEVLPAHLVIRKSVI